jgi:exopolysaccharide production protein ExoZ
LSRERQEGTGAVAEVRQFYPLIDQLRAIAALLVVYAHMVGNFLDAHAHLWLPDTLVDYFVRDPARAELNFGWPGVALFFFISGFVVTHAAVGEGGREFAIKRVLRIYPPVIAVVVVVSILANLGILTTGISAAPTPLESLAAATFANYALATGPALVAVAWTLVIEVLFYGGLLAVKPLLSRIPLLAPAALLIAVVVAVLVLRGPFAGIPPYVAFVPILVLGMIIYLLHTGRVKWWIGALLLLASWVVLVWALQLTNPGFWDPTGSFLVNVLLAGCVFALTVLMDGRISPWRVLAVVAKRSYSLYLVHVPVGVTLLYFFVDGLALPYTVSLLMGLIAVAVVTELSYRFVEQPAIGLGKRIAARLRRPRLAATEGVT